MSTKRTFGTLAAIGGATAVLALLCSVPSARADELSDLRVNNELLQQRLDQLAHAPQMGPGQHMNQAPAIAGSFPRSFLIPGTDTSIRVGGNITLITDTFLEGGIANGSPWNSTIGANGAVNSIGVGTTSNSKGSNNWGFTARQSQLFVETRTPTPYGEARTYLSFDFANSNSYVPGGSGPSAIADNLSPRMKYAYGTLGGWLAGQANSNFEDADANPETIDFGGNVGEPGKVRVAQIRYTMPLTWAWGGALSFSAENPQTQAMTAYGQCASDAGIPSACTGAIGSNPTKATSPNLTAALIIPQPWGHVDIAGVLLPAQTLSDGKFLNRSYTGGGGAFSFDVKPGWFTPKDDILFHVVAGEGIGSYLNNFTNFSIESNYTGLTTAPTGACPAALPAAGVGVPASCVRSKLVEQFGGTVGYTHWWSPTLHSTVSFGIQEQNGVNASYLSAAAAAGANRRIETAHANLMWKPVPFVTVGIEYMWGERWAVAVPTGTPDSNQLQTVIGKFDVAF